MRRQDGGADFQEEEGKTLGLGLGTVALRGSGTSRGSSVRPAAPCPAPKSCFGLLALLRATDGSGLNARPAPGGAVRPEKGETDSAGSGWRWAPEKEFMSNFGSPKLANAWLLEGASHQILSQGFGERRQQFMS